MQSDNSEEFYDVSTRNKKFGRVDAMNGPVLLEKYVLSSFLTIQQDIGTASDSLYFRLTHFVQSPSKTDKFTTLSSRFGIKS